MHAQQRQVRIGRVVVEDVPGSLDPIGVRDRNQLRPSGGETVETARRELRCRRVRLGYHASSMRPAFRPEPIPRQSTESPVASVSATEAKVIGMAAGPMLP